MGFLNKCFGGCGSTSKKQSSATIEDLCHRFSLSQLRKSTNDFDRSRIISKGGRGVVYRGCISINRELGDIVLKWLYQHVASISSEELRAYKDNIIYRWQLQHPNVVSLVGYCDDGNEFISVHDYAPNGSLHHQLYRIDSNSRTLSGVQTIPVFSSGPILDQGRKGLEISIGVARGLHYLHSGTKRTIIHRDITPASILLDENWVPKLKFNGFSVKGPKFSKKDVQPVELKDGILGTYGFVAPEMLLPGPNVTDKCDVYSFGSVLFELICGKTPCQIMSEHGKDFHSSDLAKIRNVEGIIDKRLVGEMAKECWELYMDITQSCLNEDPKERPHMGDVELQLEHVLQLQEEADTDRASYAFLI